MIYVSRSDSSVLFIEGCFMMKLSDYAMDVSFKLVSIAIEFEVYELCLWIQLLSMIFNSYCTRSILKYFKYFYANSKHLRINFLGSDDVIVIKQIYYT